MTADATPSRVTKVLDFERIGYTPNGEAFLDAFERNEGVWAAAARMTDADLEALGVRAKFFKPGIMAIRAREADKIGRMIDRGEWIGG